MRIRKALSILLAVALLLGNSLFSSIVFGAQDSSIELQLDKTAAKVGEVITATVNINNISNFAGYQVNLKYDPAVLQPIRKSGTQYTNSTNPESGTLLNNSDFGALSQASNNTTAGILNFGKLYTNLKEYRASGDAEFSGSVAVISFKVISEKPTSIVFENTHTMPNAITGTSIFDWNGNRITSGYTVVQAGIINSDNQNPITDSNISLEYDRTSAKVGETVKVSLNVNNINNFAGYQVNLKYDPKVLQPVTASGNAYTNNTILSGGNILKNVDYSNFYQAVHNIEQGILNFSGTYLNLEEYKASGSAETTGILGVIEFKVLDGKATTVSFEDSKLMPNSLSGTLLFNWNAERISGYKVKEAGILNKNGQQVINGNVSMELDKTTALVGDIINATIKVDGISDFAGYQVNLVYDPTVLKPVTASGKEYTNTTIPSAGTLFANTDYNPYSIASHNLSAGVLNFGKSYIDLKAYRESGNAETSGTLAVISFEVLKAKSATILFENSASMPNGISGVMLFDWNGERILSGYTVTQPAIISVNDPGGDDKNSISLELDKTNASVGDIITATLKVDGIDNLAGYQVNLKYDPAVLQPVNPATGAEYGKNTNPATGNLINNSDFGVIPAAAHDLKAGILNFARSYTNLEDYRTSESEGSGTLATIGFKVLKEKATSITFENSGTMPSAIIGTMLFDWFGNKITSGYEVIQPKTINADVMGSDSNYITMDFDKTNAAVGDIIKATVMIDEIDNFAGYQVNLKYDPEVLQPVNSSGAAYTNSTIPASGSLLSNQDFVIMPVASHNTTNGILNFSKTYTNLEEYKLSGKAEETGSLAVISFKVLKVEPTTVTFESTNTMPNAISGTMLFNWNAERIISGYTVIQPPVINATSPTESSTPTKTAVVTPINTATPKPTVDTTPTNTVTPTNTSTIRPTPTNSQTGDESYITIELDKTTAKVNDTITATVMVNDIENLAGYQINLIYDPAVLQPITSGKAPYTNSSIPSSGALLSNIDYGVIPAASHNVTEGKLNFGRAYTNLGDYRASRMPENSGSLAVITFKALAEGTTSIKFENSATMPNSITGTALFDWNGNRIASGYKVIQAEEININSSSTSTPDPTTTPTTVPTATATPTTPDSSSYITIDFDKTTAEVGETIKATIRVNEISNLSGYQINLKYDPEVLQPIRSSGASYTNGTIPSSGSLIANADFGPINAVSHTLDQGKLNFGKLYTVLEEYKFSRSPEQTGTLAVIEFKVLKADETTVRFESSSSMPNGINGTMLFDWNGERISSGYTVIQPTKIN